eukprot:scaffold92581_cov30-Phaeocystis_antarctica.AAC.1
MSGFSTHFASHSSTPVSGPQSVQPPMMRGSGAGGAGTFESSLTGHLQIGLHCSLLGAGPQ